MEREDIEKAAKDYSIGKTHFRRSVLKEVDADNYVLRKDNCREDFIAGAEWRINSVWHDAREIIVKMGYVLVEFKTKRGVSYNIWKIANVDVVSYWNTFITENKIIRYAYIEDLLPNTEE